MSEKVICEICGVLKTKSRLEAHQKKCFPRYCLNCNKQIFGENKRIKFCCHNCSVEYSIKDIPKKYCIVCGKEIISKHAVKFCSRGCSAQLSNRSENRDRKVSNQKTSEALKIFYSDEKNLETIRNIKRMTMTEEVKEKIKKASEKNRKKYYISDNWLSFGYDGVRNFLMIEQNYSCSECGLTEWNGKPLPLELHHIDGNRNNNSKENCVMLCSNCHAQTSNFRGKKHGNEKLYSDEEVLSVLRDSKNIRQALIKLGYVPKGKNYKRMHRIINDFNIEHLMKKYSSNDFK